MKNLNQLFKIILICCFSILIGCGNPQEQVITTSTTSEVTKQISNVTPHALGVEDILSMNKCNYHIHYETIEDDGINFSKTLNCFVLINQTFETADFTVQDIYDNFFESMNLYVDVTPIEGTLSPIGVLDLNQKCCMVYDYILQAYDISKTNWNIIFNMIENKWPILIWYTNNVNEVKEIGKTQWNELPVITVEITDDLITLFNPLEGYFQVPTDEFKNVWETCGRHGIVFYK